MVSFWGCQKPSETTTTDTYTETYLQSEAVALAEQQLQAYNQRNLDAFLVPYSDSVKVYNSLHQFGYQGLDNMRENYAGWFNTLDSLHCEVVNRIATGNTVIDHERVYFKRPKQDAQIIEALAIYKIGQGKIQEVHFVRPE